MTYKIVKVSNFDDETYSESFVENLPVLHQHPAAQKVADVFNSLCDQRGPDYYKVVEEGYKLYIFKGF